MCGVAGVLRLDGGRPDERVMARMTAAIAHRGPDGEGLYVDGPIALGHRRLAIIDLSADAAQPMHSTRSGNVLVYNGELYNFRELRREYEGRGYVFRSRTDSEVVLAGHELDGIDAVRRFNGMFAFALWDEAAQRLWLVRDRFGVKPLYWATAGSSFLFGSEIGALLRHPNMRVDLDMAALDEYFTFQNLIGERTLFANVRLLPPATIAWIDAAEGELHVSRYWDYDFAGEVAISAREAEEETLRLFVAAVERQLVSDVPVGSYLSGGMDSGSITAVASSRIARLATFTCGFHMQDVSGAEAAFDERTAAELMAQRFGTEHFEQVIGPADLQWSLPQVVGHLQDLRVGMSYPNFLAARLAARFVKVCLSGAGGDELFGGYPWRYYRVAGAQNRAAFLSRYYGFWQRLVPDPEKGAFFQPCVMSAPGASFAAFAAVFGEDRLDFSDPADPVRAALYFEAKVFLQGLLLVGDRLAMASGLEERVPFLDNELVEFAMRLPVQLKIGDLHERLAHGGTDATYVDTQAGKAVLRRAMARLIPREVAERRKQGFSAPDESWFRGPNRDFVRRMLVSRATVSTEYIRPEYISGVLERHDRGENMRLLLWSLLCFEQWCRTFLAGQDVAAAAAVATAAG